MLSFRRQSVLRSSLCFVTHGQPVLTCSVACFVAAADSRTETACSSLRMSPLVFEARRLPAAAVAGRTSSLHFPPAFGKTRACQ
jgi:hypothetical protein